MKLSLSKELKAQKFNPKKRCWAENEGAGVINAETELKVVTYNVWFSSYYRKARCEALLEILRNCDADVIGLQEVTPSFLKILLKQEWVRNDYFVSDAKGATVDPYGVLLLSRIPLGRLVLYKLPSYMNRKLLLGELCVNGEAVTVATVHLESQKSSAARRAEQLSILFSLIENSVHSLIVGDFNFCSSWTSENANLDSSYQDMWPVLRSDEPGYTEDTDINIMRLEQKGKEKKVRFDRILIRSSSPGWQPQSIQIIGTEPISVKHSNVLPSDHFGLAGKIAWQTNLENLKR